MTFNDNITLDTSGVSRGRGRGLKVGGGVGGLGIIGVILYFALTGNVDLSMLSQSLDLQPGQQASVEDLSSECVTGADANENSLCRMVGGKNSLDAFWDHQLQAESGVSYAPAELVLYDGSTSTACGTGSSDMGPFYCPADSAIYIDVSFYDQLEEMGAENTSLAQLYILAHEWGHHIQNQLGLFSQIDQRDLGENGDAVRSELQADCLAGAWIKHASETVDADTGHTYIRKPTQEQITSALAAANSVGDDTIYENAGMSVNPDNFSHGSSEKRIEWLTRGIEEGTIAACNTFDIAAP